MRRRLPKGAWVDDEGNQYVPLRRRRWPTRVWFRVRRWQQDHHVYHLWWYVRLAAWMVTALPLGLLVSWRLAFLGPVAFEAWLAAANYRAARRMRDRPRPPSGPWDEPDAGDREPRNPLPLAGAGAIALPEPGEGAG